MKGPLLVKSGDRIVVHHPSGDTTMEVLIASRNGESLLVMLPGSHFGLALTWTEAKGYYADLLSGDGVPLDLIPWETVQ